MRVLITGSAGRLATSVLPMLKQPGRTLRLLDIAPQSASDGVEIVQASVTDMAEMVTACQGIDAVIHLGGLSTEAPWPEILSVNIAGTHNVLEAARRAGVRRVLLASSHHAVGFAPNDGQVLPDYAFPRPDTFYGVGKVAMESLGSMYHDRYGLDVICVRIGSCIDQPVSRRMLATWLSPADCARLFEAALTVPSPGFRVVWGVSANSRGWLSLDEARRLGYQPEDDAEDFAAAQLARDDQWDHYLGGPFCSPEMDANQTS